MFTSSTCGALWIALAGWVPLSPRRRTRTLRRCSTTRSSSEPDATRLQRLVDDPSVSICRELRQSSPSGVRGSDELGFGATLFSVGVSSYTLTELSQLVAGLRASEGSCGVSTRPCSGRRAVAVLREASRPHHLSIHTAFDRLEGSRGSRPSSSVRGGGEQTWVCAHRGSPTTAELASG